MPRLVGKQSNTAAPLSLLILLAIGVVTTLEYTGFINIINNFGYDRLDIKTYPDRS